MSQHRDAFLCYASEDLDTVVKPLAASLEAAGITCWLGKRDVHWGENWQERISEALANSRVAIAVISANSIGKYWPTRELNAALLREESSKDFRVLPLLVGDAEAQRSFLQRSFQIADHHFLAWERDPEPIVAELRDYLSETLDTLLPSGYHDIEQVRKARMRLKGEVFLIELIEDPIELRCEDGSVVITVDRRWVKECIVDNDGKRKLNEERIEPFPEVIHTLDEKDREIQAFLANPSSESLTIDPRELKVPLRWASGGVLSLVHFQGRDWVPLFFRDIPPYGWNLSLGSTEREFDEPGLARLQDDREHRNPWDFISREFREESIVTDRPPDAKTGPAAFCPFDKGVRMTGPAKRRWRKHVELRRRCDGLSEAPDGASIALEAVHPGKRIVLKIRSKAFGRDPAETSEVDDVLVCFSLRDLGIEIVNLFRYELPKSGYLLDGEIDEEGCLVRMPMALFSLDYLADVFSNGAAKNRLVAPFGAPPSIEAFRAPLVDEEPSACELIPFLWDVGQRRKIIDGDLAASEHERKRFTKWDRRFHDNFFDADDRPSLANPSRLFVPATAKILHLYFSGLAT